MEYPSIFALMTDLQAMGESNAVVGMGQDGKGSALSRDVLMAAEGIYRELHGEEGGRGLPATFRVIYMIGWTKGEGQPEPMERGSGMVSIKDVLEGREKIGKGEGDRGGGGGGGGDEGQGKKG